MNALKTVVKQIETFGTLTGEYTYSHATEKRYRIDTVTTAVIFYKPNGKPKQVSFIYG
jgi:hypothetical protein